jgi:hypothetical protein
MPGLNHAALLGLAAGDQSLFAPAAAPFAQLTAPVSAPAVAGPVYALGGDAIMQPVAQPPVEYVQLVEPTADSQFWWVAGLGALAAVGAAAAKGRPAAVADLDTTDLEAARSIAMLGVGGQFNRSGQEKATSNANYGKQSKFVGGKGETPFGNLTGFLMQGRRSKGEEGGQTRGELELLSGVVRPDSDNAEVLANRFRVTYDTRTKAGPKKLQSANRGKATRTGNVGFRSKNPTNYLYGKVGQKSTTWWGKFGGNQS